LSSWDVRRRKRPDQRLALANNNPANANYRFHGALIARSTVPVKIDLRSSSGANRVPQVTDFHRIAAIMGYPSQTLHRALFLSNSNGHQGYMQIFAKYMRLHHATD
jgi:hypothetical protein